jgi:hypothetical protein
MTRTHRTLTESDIGKHVVNADGEDVGVVSNVDDGVGYVDPEPGLADRIRSRLGWGHTDEDDYPLKRSQIAEITEDEVRLRRD